jgi:hypothetical protein
MYIDSTNYVAPFGDQPVAKLLRANLEDLLVQHKVQLAFWGHHHSYQRYLPFECNSFPSDRAMSTTKDVGIRIIQFILSLAWLAVV